MPDNPKRMYDVRFRKLGDRYILGKGMDTYEVDEVGLRIWQHCDGNHSISDIAQKMVEEYDVDLDQAASDCAEFIAELGNKGLIEWQ